MKTVKAVAQRISPIYSENLIIILEFKGKTVTLQSKEE